MIIDGFEFRDAPKIPQYLITVYSVDHHTIEDRWSDFMSLKDIADLIRGLSRLQLTHEEIYLRISEPTHLTGKYFRGGSDNAEKDG